MDDYLPVNKSYQYQFTIRGIDQLPVISSSASMP
jgi:hypothetical protein